MDGGNLSSGASASASGAIFSTQPLTVTSTTDSATNPTYVIVTATYPFATITNFPGVTSTTSISRSVRATVTPLTPK